MRSCRGHRVGGPSADPRRQKTPRHVAEGSSVVGLTGFRCLRDLIRRFYRCLVE